MQVLAGIADHGSLTAAAKALSMSLPAVVRALAALEADLGVRLSNRTTRSVAVTDEGPALSRTHPPHTAAGCGRSSLTRCGNKRAAGSAFSHRGGAVRSALRRARHHWLRAPLSQGARGRAAARGYRAVEEFQEIKTRIKMVEPLTL